LSRGAMNCPTQALLHGRVYTLLRAFLRHELSAYDEILNRAPENEREALRSRLRSEIERAAQFQYPWLRLSPDPRPSWAAQITPKKGRVLTDASRYRCEAIERRALLLGLLRKEEVRRDPVRKARYQEMLALR
jgi:hypothetical protein